ncbi:PREDICTED: uncharacterized protein LOC109126511 [Camelina sativa]|uniref:Uncharacterized protein LOC109126511 n=1 Tax=Camelina sativa TaxID=90675 RepID=A0ABM1QFZ2_CAMSA|nr:PREDICTED: uncharacterized protein LOC109126511 [Camelina sativa]
MEKSILQAPPQSFTFQIFDTIDGDFCKEDVLVRLIYFWEARNFKKRNMLMGVELLLIDSKSNAAQAYIPENCLFHYEGRLKSNSVYTLNNFMIIASKKPIGDHQIDEQKFCFRSFDADVAETKQYLTWKLASTVFGTILDIQPQYGWYYISCSKCNNKLEKADTSLYCNYCKESNNIGVNRYRFEIRVYDIYKDVATFVVLDSEATKIAGHRAADVLNEEMEASSTASYTEINLQTPECLKHIVGNTCKFQIKLSEYNFKTSRQTVSISRILETITDHPAESEEGSSTKLIPEIQSTTTTGKSRGKSHVNDSTDKNGSTQEKRPRPDNK